MRHTDQSLMGVKRMSAGWVLLIPIMIGTLFSVGCNLPRPDWRPPGSMEQQQSRSLQHDPYPSTELGPPIEGGRPLGFDLPRPEVMTLQTSPSAKRNTGGLGF